MRKKKYSNRSALIEIFWEHVLPLGPMASFRSWVQRPGALEAQFDLCEALAMQTLAAMQDDRERDAVLIGNRLAFNGRLTPGADFFVPSWPVDSESDIDELYTLFDKWYGASKGKAFRCGIDIKSYGQVPALFLQEAAFRLSDPRPNDTHPTWSLLDRSPAYQVCMQCYPCMHLYCLVDHQQGVIFEFDDWPSKWTRSWA